MRHCSAIVPLLGLILLSAGCAAPRGYPSLAPRAAETIDPRAPIAVNPSPGTLDPRTASLLAEAVAEARDGRAAFASFSRTAEALTAAAGPRQSDSWVAAQAALSSLVAQHGVTTKAAADIDAIAAQKIADARWLVPAARAAIEAAAADVESISNAQRAVIDRLSARLGS